MAIRPGATEAWLLPDLASYTAAIRIIKPKIYERVNAQHIPYNFRHRNNTKCLVTKVTYLVVSTIFVVAVVESRKKILVHKNSWSVITYAFSKIGIVKKEIDLFNNSQLLELLSSSETFLKIIKNFLINVDKL